MNINNKIYSFCTNPNKKVPCAMMYNTLICTMVLNDYQGLMHIQAKKTNIDNKITSILIIKSEYIAITLTINAVTW